MINQENYEIMKDYALYLLSLRMQSSGELKRKLQNKFPPADSLIEDVLSDLKRTRLVDDRSFIEQYIRHRLATSPRSLKLIERELWKFDLDKDLIMEVSGNFDSDQTEIIKELADNKLRTIDDRLDKRKKRDKLMRFLISRGFDLTDIYSIIKEIDFNK